MAAPSRQIGGTNTGRCGLYRWSALITLNTRIRGLTCPRDRAPGGAPEINANGNIPGHHNKDLPDDYGSRGLADGSIILFLNEEGVSMHGHKYEDTSAGSDSGDEGTILGDTECNNGTNIAEDNVTDDPQWITCEDGSYTPWRYAYQEPGPQALWMDVSRYQPHSDAEYNRIEEVEEEYYEEDFESDIMDDVGEDGQEYPDDADYIESDEEGDCVSQECIVEGAETIDMMLPDIANDNLVNVNVEVNATLLAIDAKASPADGSGDSDVSTNLSTVGVISPLVIPPLTALTDAVALSSISRLSAQSPLYRLSITRPLSLQSCSAICYNAMRFSQYVYCYPALPYNITISLLLVYISPEHRMSRTL